MSLAASPIHAPDPRPAPGGEQAGEIIARTRGLFELLVTVCDGSRTLAKRLTGTDERTLEALRSVPNVDFVSRLGLALGIDSRATAGIVGSSGRFRPSAADVRHAILAADLNDDAAELDRLATHLGQDPDHPSQLGLAQLVLARAAVSRGQFASARHAVEVALAIGMAAGDRAVVGTLARSIAQESLLGEAWNRRIVRQRGAEHLAWLASCSGDIVESELGAARDRAWRIAAQWRRGDLGSADAVNEFHRELERSADRRALAWCASIAALAAMRAQPGSAALRLIVCAQLAIDDALGQSSHGERQLLLARRARVTVGEWSLRARAGEIDAALLDDTDSAELTCARMRCSVDGAVGNFFHSQTSVLDALSSDGWMRGLVPSLHAMGAVAGSRSEDQC